MGRQSRDEHFPAILLKEPVSSSHFLCSLSCFTKPAQHTGAVEGGLRAITSSCFDITRSFENWDSHGFFQKISHPFCAVPFLLPIVCVQKNLVKNC